MALQGDLTSFALPDVLRLLAGTGKSGRLDVDGDRGVGELEVANGFVYSGAVTTAPAAIDAADVLFELLRFADGAFVFDEGEVDTSVDGAPIDDVIARAEELVAEWTEVETVVPSMAAWISIAPEIEGEQVKISASQWRMLAAIGGGGNVTDLAAALELTDLAACRSVKELADGGLVSVKTLHTDVPPAVELDSFEEFEVEAAIEDPLTDLEDLMVDDRPVVMEEREDALLPEPLPGEGVAFEGETLTGVVDGRMFDGEPDAEAVVGGPEGGDAAPFSESEPASAYDSATFVEPTEAPSTVDETSPELTAPPELQAADAMTPGDAIEDPDDERGSLLRFLSTVKP